MTALESALVMAVVSDVMWAALLVFQQARARAEASDSMFALVSAGLSASIEVGMSALSSALVIDVASI